MKKYLYNLNNKIGYYTLKEIASTINVDYDFLEEILEDEESDIDLACLAAFHEKNKKTAIEKLLDIYPTKYICSNNINELINNQIEIKKEKIRLLNSLNYLNDCKTGTINLNKKTLNTIIVNTEDDINKTVMRGEMLDEIKSMKALFGNTNERYITNSNFCLVTHTKSSSNLTISIENTKKLLSNLREYKLPINYNVKITEEIVKDSSTDTNNKGFVYSYIRRH